MASASNVDLGKWLVNYLNSADSDGETPAIAIGKILKKLIKDSTPAKNASVDSDGKSTVSKRTSGGPKTELWKVDSKSRDAEEELEELEKSYGDDFKCCRRIGVRGQAIGKYCCARAVNVSEVSSPSDYKCKDCLKKKVAASVSDKNKSRSHPNVTEEIPTAQTKVELSMTEIKNHPNYFVGVPTKFERFVFTIDNETNQKKCLGKLPKDIVPSDVESDEELVEMLLSIPSHAINDFKKSYMIEVPIEKLKIPDASPMKAASSIKKIADNGESEKKKKITPVNDSDSENESEKKKETSAKEKSFSSNKKKINIPSDSDSENESEKKKTSSSQKKKTTPNESDSENESEKKKTSSSQKKKTTPANESDSESDSESEKKKSSFSQKKKKAYDPDESSNDDEENSVKVSSPEQGDEEEIKPASSKKNSVDTPPPPSKEKKSLSSLTDKVKTSTINSESEPDVKSLSDDEGDTKKKQKKTSFLPSKLKKVEQDSDDD